MMCLDLAKTTCLKSLGKGKFQNKAFIIKSCFKFLKQPFLKKRQLQVMITYFADSLDPNC